MSGIDFGKAESLEVLGVEVLALQPPIWITRHIGDVDAGFAREVIAHQGVAIENPVMETAANQGGLKATGLELKDPAGWPVDDKPGET